MTRKRLNQIALEHGFLVQDVIVGPSNYHVKIEVARFIEGGYKQPPDSNALMREIFNETPLGWIYGVEIV